MRMPFLELLTGFIIRFKRYWRTWPLLTFQKAFSILAFTHGGDGEVGILENLFSWSLLSIEIPWNIFHCGQWSRGLGLHTWKAQCCKVPLLLLLFTPVPRVKKLKKIITAEGGRSTVSVKCLWAGPLHTSTPRFLIPCTPFGPSAVISQRAQVCGECRMPTLQL